MAAAHQGRSDHGAAPQGGPQQGGVVVVARQQRHRQRQRLQHFPQADVTAPALVIAEVTADQQQIGGLPERPKLAEGLLEPMVQQVQRRPAMAAAGGIGEQMGITQLKNSHRRPLWLALSGTA